MTKQTYLKIIDMHCASCVNKIETALRSVAGVSLATVNFAERSAMIEGDAEPQTLIQAITDVGYQAEIERSDQLSIQIDKQNYHKLILKTVFSATVGLLIFISTMFYPLIPDLVLDYGQFSWFCIGLLVLAVFYYSAGHIFSSAWKACKNRTANMDTLIAIGTGAAWLFSMAVVIFLSYIPIFAQHTYFDTAALVITLINLGSVLETRARGKASASIMRLIGLQANTARLVQQEKETDIPIEQVIIGNLLRVRPGEKIPVDGEIIEGHTSIDESMLSGEPMAVIKKAGGEVYAGTINNAGTFLFEAKRVGEETALARIISLVRQAQNSKPEISRLVDKIASIFVPIVLAIALLTAIVWFSFGPEPHAVYTLITAMTVLLIACPCALGLATPMSVIVGVGKAAEYGILIRNGQAIQQSATLTTILLDKTGTITKGKPCITNIISAGNNSSDELLRLAASLEAGSEHPLASAMLNAAKEKNIKLATITQFENIPGHGIQAQIDGKKFLLGNEKILQRNAISTDDCQQKAINLSSEAKTVIYLANEKQCLGLIAIADPIKSDSKQAINTMKKMGLKVIMLTGDNQKTAASVAKQIGIDNFFAELLPKDKLEKIKQLQQQGEIIGMVGDGINDAPALAQAHVGFAIGSGTDVAMESADVTLIRGSLQTIPSTIAISKATLRNIKQNLIGAFAYNTIAIPLAAGVLYPWLGVLLHPLVAASAMAMSSVTVVSNANRLRFFKTSQ